MFTHSLDDNYSVIDVARRYEIRKKEYGKEILEYLNHIVERFEFAVNFIESVDKDPLAGKQQFSSILEEL